MSTTDLELRQELPQLQIPTIRIITNPAIETPISDSNDDGCHTPTSTEHKIPAILSCPPAPKKPRRAAISCKRKLCKLNFFETVAREEVEPCFVYVNAYHVLKMRRCRVCGQILPAFCQLSNKFPKLSFVYADIDECPETTQNIRYTPTFHIYRDGERVDEMFGGGEERLHDRLWLHS